jgi:Flp pilus assembly protein TadG
MQADGRLGKRRLSRNRGYVLITMAAAAVALFGALGLAVDVGRLFIGKSEAQAFCDSAALAATMQLNGTANGITAAQNAVTNSVNTWNLDSTSVTNPGSGQSVATYTVDFGTSSTGPWSTNPGAASGYVYTRVQATLPVKLFFIPVVVSQQLQNVQAMAVGGQIAQPGIQQGLDPYSAVGPDPTDTTNFGLVPGQQYDIQWPAYNGSRGGCSPSNPDACFVKPTCSGESAAAKQEVVTQWGASINGYWGSNSNSTISAEVLNEIQLQPAAVGSDISMSTGNKNAEASALDTRVNQDNDLTDNDPTSYQNNVTDNGRRRIALPIVTPTVSGGSAAGYVLGYGSFLLISNGNPSNYYTAGNGNDPFCAVYAGPYCQGCTGTGGGSVGYYKIKLVQ